MVWPEWLCPFPTVPWLKLCTEGIVPLMLGLSWVCSLFTNVLELPFWCLSSLFWCLSSLSWCLSCSCLSSLFCLHSPKCTRSLNSEWLHIHGFFSLDKLYALLPVFKLKLCTGPCSQALSAHACWAVHCTISLYLACELSSPPPPSSHWRLCGGERRYSCPAGTK